MAQRDINKIDKTILDNFYKLVHSQVNVRLTAAASTFKILEAFKKQNQEKFNENLNYCVERLVGGLASSRALARQGYGTLLLDLLGNFQISTERLLTIAQQKFGNIGKDATRDSLLGYFLLIAIIMNIGIYKKSKSSNQYLEKMHKHLMQLVNTKSYFETSVGQLLVEYNQSFYAAMLADIPPHAFGSDSKLSAIQLLSLILCNKIQPIRELVSLDGATFLEICSILKNDKLQKRPLHPIFFEASKFVIDFMPLQFETFFTTILCPVFFKANHNELATMGLELTVQLIESTNSTEAIKTMMSDHLIRLLVLSLKSKNKLYKPSTEFFTSLKNHFATILKDDSTDKSILDKKQYTILAKLTSSPGSLSFDKDTNNHCLSELLNQCTSTVLKKHLDRMVDFMLKKPIKDDQHHLATACLRQIAFIVCRTQLIEEQAKRVELLKFVLINLFFQKNGKFEESNNYKLLHLNCNKEAKESIRIALKNAYHTILHHLVSTNNSAERIDLFDDLISYCNDLLNDSHLSYNNEELANEESGIVELWSDYMKSLNAYKNIVKKHKNSKQLYPITTLFYFYGLQVFEHHLKCSEQLDELIQSSTDSLEGDPSDGTWADILTDQIIAILSATECSPWIRKLCDSVFGSLLPHISPASIDLLCDVIKAPIGDDDDDADENSEEGSEVDEAEMDTSDKNDNVDSDEDMSVDDDDTSDSSDEESMPDVSGDEEIVDNSEIEPVDKTDDEDDDDSDYMDDDQMMRLDSVISDMFKLNRVGKKKKLDPSFKLRCLDLVKKILIKKRNDKETVARILETIVPVANLYRKSAETRPISEKINRMLPKTTSVQV